ncbi:MAG TPA: polysaccharide deacetylase family protein [bacterium]|nr:polysaccharide deacetylase family protein [bacterium]
MFIVLKLIFLWTTLFGPLTETTEPVAPKPVPVLMYHQMGNRGGRYSITPRDFERQLEDMRRAGFFLINLSELLRGDFSRVPTGKRPVVLTFDDSDPGQFRVLPDGRIDPLSAVGVLEKYRKQHPEFGSGAAFFIFARDERGSGIFFQPERWGLIEAFCGRYGLSAKGRGWGRPRLWQAKLRWLVANGYEVGNHTVTHTDLAKLDPEGIAREIGVCQLLLEEAIGDREGYLWGLCYPFGAVPLGAAEYMLCREGRFEGRPYRFDYAMAAWGGMCPNPATDEFAAVRRRIPRVEMHAVRGGGGLDTRWLTRYADSYVKEADEGDWPLRDLLTASLASFSKGLCTWFAPGPSLGLEHNWTAARLDGLDRAFWRPLKRLPPPPAYF